MTLSKSQQIDLEKHVAQVASDMRKTAALGEFDGRMSPQADRYIAMCRFVDSVTHCTLIFTRDSGHHSSGWLRNADYERCLHLSISRAPDALVLPARQRMDAEARTRRMWVLAFFGEDAKLAWFESPKSNHGRRAGVTHWRVFADETWTPILPRGEVYSKEFTEMGWRSASQVLEEDGRVIISSVDPT